MLDPKAQLVLLPQDREVMAVTGMTEAEYRQFVLMAMQFSKPKPCQPTALAPLTLALINLAIGILLTGLSMLLAPKAQEPEEAEMEESKVDGQDVVRKDRFAPKAGFNSVQNVVELGSVVPIVYAKKEEIGGKYYGGIRVNTNMLWSQILSVGGGQFFRGIFLVGEGPVNLESRQHALGNNTLASYELDKNADAGRITTYFANKGGRIDKDDYQLGVIPANDPGAFDQDDIYEIENSTHFCQAIQPSNQTEFGVFGHIGNNFGYKQGEPFVACSQWQQGDEDFQRQDNQQKIAEARKGATTFHTRAGFIGSQGLKSVSKDDILTYKIFKDSVQDLKFEKDGAGAGDQADGVVNCRDIATTVSSIQRGFDEAINVGDLYRAGSAIVVCTDRDDPFISEVDYDGSGNDMEAKFKVIEPGKVHVWSESDVNRGVNDEYDSERIATICSERSQLFRLLVGAFSVERAFKTIEVGLQSNVGLKSAGITNFNSLIAEDDFAGQDGVPSKNNSYQAYTDAVYCGGLDDGDNGGDYRREILVGRYNASDARYSFFRILYRENDEDGDFETSDNLYGVRSTTGVDVYNYLRFKFSDSKRREFRFMPVSSWEIRYGHEKPDERDWDDLYAIDAHDSNEESVDENGFDLEFNGKKITDPDEEFALKAFQNPNTNKVQLGIAPHDDSDEHYVDAYARIAEAFIYDAVSTTAGEPEHRISYVNIISENESVPNYADMAIVGLNIRSSKELRSLDQLSVYVEEGVIDSHLFPEVFQDLLTNKRYGVGSFFSTDQIDTGSFATAATWTNGRKYFFDGVISKKLNLRSWASDIAPHFLLDLSVSGGKFKLSPVVNFGGPETVNALFTAGNIIEDSFEMNYFDAQDRLAPVVSVKWREERKDSSIDSRGLFPQVREVLVRRKDTPSDAPEEQIDMSDFCTNENHAIERAKWLCQQRKYQTHAVKFKTVPTEAPIQAGSIIKVGLETLKYDSPTAGSIASDGTVQANPMPTGKVQCITWDGETMKTETLDFDAGKVLGKSNLVFMVTSSEVISQGYKVQAIGFDEDGNLDVEAVYWPLESDGTSSLTKDFADSNFTIER